MQVLNNVQIQYKIKRLAIEILENNLQEKELILAGINNNGYRFAELILAEIKSKSNKNISLHRIKLNPADPLSEPVQIDIDTSSLVNKCIIIIDDVANTGRTVFYAFKILMDILPKKVEVAVLVDRTHKLFPTKVDYVGLSLATTIQEHIKANLKDIENLQVELN